MDARAARILSFAGVATCFAAGYVATRSVLRGTPFAGEAGFDVLIGAGAWVLLALTTRARNDRSIAGGPWPVAFGWLAPVLGTVILLARTPFLIAVLVGNLVLAGTALAIVVVLERTTAAAVRRPGP